MYGLPKVTRVARQIYVNEFLYKYANMKKL